MINKPDVLKHDIPIDLIEELAELVGYSGYLPIGVIRDLYYAQIHKKWGSEIKDSDFPYNKLIIETVNMFKNNSNTLINTLEALKALSPRVNFKQLEIATTGKQAIYEDNSMNQKNYKVDLNSLSSKSLEILKIPIVDDMNTVELSEEVLQIIEFQNGVIPIIGKSLTTKDIVYSNMLSHNEISKVRKYKFASPLFNVKFAQKQLLVRKIEDQPTQFDNIIVMVDLSLSTAGLPLYRQLITGVLLKILDNFNDDVNSISIIEFTDQIRDIIETDKSGLEEFIRRGITPIASSIYYKGGFRELTKFNGKTILLLTDGTADFVSELPRKVRWNIVSLYQNSKLAQLASATGGNFINTHSLC